MILFLHILLFSYFVKNHLLMIFGVVICTGYTIFANTLNSLKYKFRNNSQNECLVKLNVHVVCLLG